MAMTRVCWAAGILACLSLGSASCGSQYGDPIVGSVDPCSRWTSRVECLGDTAHGCSFQPNLVGCHAEDTNCPAGTCGGGDPYVRRVGETLWLHGEPYTFLGAVSWSVAWSDNGCRDWTYSTHDESLVRTFDDLADMKASALRLWAFQSYAGTTGSDYTSFERVVDYARRAGVRLMMVLENRWGDCTEGGDKNDAWFAGGYRSPYGAYPLSYRDYVQGVVDRFKDEPTLLGWELMHEAQGTDFAALDGFAQEMSVLVRGIDQNHLIALGTDNGDSPATSREGEPSNYQRLHAHPPIDLVDVQDFDLPDAASVSSLPRQLGIANTLVKATFNGATAVGLGDTSAAAFANRGAAITRKLDAYFGAGLVGFLVYDYFPGWERPGWDFDGRAEDPLGGPAGILSRHARLNH